VDACEIVRIGSTFEPGPWKVDRIRDDAPLRGDRPTETWDTPIHTGRSQGAGGRAHILHSPAGFGESSLRPRPRVVSASPLQILEFACLRLASRPRAGRLNSHHACSSRMTR
jgi:hypothetical protein